MEQPTRRERSHSPDNINYLKLHVSNLPVWFQNQQLAEVFNPYGTVEDVRIIRKGSNGQVLKESVYGFVQMGSEEEARIAMKSLNEKGWTINYGKRSNRNKKMQQQSNQIEPNQLPLPTYPAFQHNAQATQIMLLNNANPNPGQPMDSKVMIQMITKNHPNAFTVSGVLPQFQSSLLVREIWIGNISPSTEKNLIYEAFKVYGEIEGIEMFSSKGFAFTKYRKIVSATRAYEQAQGILVDGRPVKVAFADPTRRYDIVGDSNVPEDPAFDPMDDDNFKNLFLGYSAGITIPSERSLRAVFQRYGKVRSIYIKQATQSGGRPYAFVDFDKGEQAAHARRMLYTEDTDGSRRAEIGDPALEISFKNTYSSNKPKSYPDSKEPESEELTRKLLSQSSDVLKFLSPLEQGVNPMMQAPPMQYNPMQQYTTNQGTYLAPQIPQPINMPPQPQPILSNPGPDLHQPPPSMVQPVPAAPTSIAPPQVIQPPAASEPSPEDNQVGKTIWCGFLTRSKQHRVGVDAVLVEGSSDLIPSNIHSLNITHRVPFLELGKFKTVGMLTLEASDGTQSERFNQYITYFQGKNRAGYMVMRNLVIYVVIPSKAKEFFSEIGDDKLLLVFQDPNVPKQEAAVIGAGMESGRRQDDTESADQHGASESDPRLRRILT